MMKSFLLVSIILVGLTCSALSLPTQPEADFEVDHIRAHGNGLTKHLVIDTWITPEQYQLLLDNDIPVSQAEAISTNNFLPSAYVYPTQFLYEDETRALNAQIKKQSLIDLVTTFSAFQTRHYQSTHGVQSCNWLLNLLSNITEASPSASKIELLKFEHIWKTQFSVIAKFIGSDPTLPVVIIGAHQDSILSGGGIDGRAPGSDDNASGSMVLVEVFRILAENGFNSKRTVEFHWYSAEEQGLLGSKAIAKDYKSKAIEVYAMINYDVLGYTAKQNNPKVIAVFTDFTDPALSEFLRMVVTTFTTVPWKNSYCGYGCSDHATWFSAGYPAGHLAESEMAFGSPYMHTVNDVISTVDFDHLVDFTKITIGFINELGKQ